MGENSTYGFDTFDLSRALNGTPVGLPASVMGGSAPGADTYYTGILRASGSMYHVKLGKYNIWCDGSGYILSSPQKTSLATSHTRLQLLNVSLKSTVGNVIHQTRGGGSSAAIDALSVRDYFAMTAMEALMRCLGDAVNADDATVASVARKSYVWATAMLEAAADARVEMSVITLSEQELSLSAVGDTHRLTASLNPDDGSILIWSSHDTSVATVDQQGVVTAVGEGTCNIRCHADSNVNVYALCSVTVGGAAPEPEGE